MVDKATIKLLLESYRPQDAEDPFFAEALRAAAADSELAAWFAEMQRFDAVMVDKFQNVPVPPDVKSHILLGYQAGAAISQEAPELQAPRHLRRGWIMGGSIAAALLAGLWTWNHLPPRTPHLNALEAQAISYTSQMPALQFVCFDADVVAQWINEQADTRKMDLQVPKPGPAMSMGMIGSSVVEWNKQPVVMVCLQDGKRMAMLYILKGVELPGLPEGGTQTVQQADWVVRTTKANGQIRMLTTKGKPADLDFPIPL